MRRFAATILVELRPDLLDPQGLATEKAINQLDIAPVERTRMGKVIRLVILEKDPESAETKLDRVCREFLSNPVTETYTFELEETQS
jgi:phosphoribosylformylglycinamidine synthase